MNILKLKKFDNNFYIFFGFNLIRFSFLLPFIPPLPNLSFYQLRDKLYYFEKRLQNILFETKIQQSSRNP